MTDFSSLIDIQRIAQSGKSRDFLAAAQPGTAAGEGQRHQQPLGDAVLLISILVAALNEYCWLPLEPPPEFEVGCAYDMGFETHFAKPALLP